MFVIGQGSVRARTNLRPPGLAGRPGKMGKPGLALNFDFMLLLPKREQFYLFLINLYWMPTFKPTLLKG